MAEFISSAILLYPLSSLAVTVQEVPNPRKQNGGWVSDMAGILSNQTEAQINQIISQLEAKNGTEMAVVTVPETAPASSPKNLPRNCLIIGELARKDKIMASCF
ncbi:MULTISPECIES: TPM domain-containing protein [Fischerella]|uniref:TPM domain-containing protein n=1 Tax=Fischerella TaxID=1190 RepID=UPI000300900F|nr:MULTISPECIES: TPM domain-containing protein [Fischerella]